MATDGGPQSGMGLRSGLDEQELIDEIGLNQEEVDWRKEFVGFDEEDARRLEALTPLFEGMSDEFTERFYDHLTGFSGTADVLGRSERSVEQLKGTQTRYLESLGAQAYDEGSDPGYGMDYFRQRAVIGRLHSMLDMPPKHYVGTYQLYHEAMLEALFDRLLEDLTDRVEDGELTREEIETAVEGTREDLTSTFRLMNLDLQVAMDTYLEHEKTGVWTRALDEMINPVVVIDEDADIQVFNPAMEELTGVSTEETTGMELWEIFRIDETHDTKETIIEHVLETEQPLRGMEMQLLNHRDETIDVIISNAPMYDENDELMGAVTVMRDVTELREKERALEETQKRVATEVGSLATEQAETTHEIADTMGDLEARATEQAEMAQEMRGELLEYSTRMEEVAASAKEVTDAAEGSKERAGEGLEASTQAQKAMEDVVAQGETLVETATELHERMDEIDDVVEVIVDVADQTNMLALNARIEAAHVGEGGQGFEVVADEVKSLADETKEHTKEITDRIEDVTTQTDRTVEAARTTNDRVTEAGDDIDEALASLEGIADAVEEAVDGITEIAQANDEQADSVDEMLTMAEEYADHSEDARRAAEETATVVDDQLQIARRIREHVSELSEELE